MKKKYRRLFHQHDIHDYCKIVKERQILGYDTSSKYIQGPAITEYDDEGNVLSVRHEQYDVTTIMGDPIYGDEIEVHK